GRGSLKPVRAQLGSTRLGTGSTHDASGTVVVELAAGTVRPDPSEWSTTGTATATAATAAADARLATTHRRWRRWLAAAASSRAGASGTAMSSVAARSSSATSRS